MKMLKTACILLLSLSLTFAGSSLGDLGTFGKWSKVEIEMTGPNSTGLGSPNPFDITVDVTFTGPGNTTIKVPAFYDGSGSGSMNGNVWKVRFAPDKTGSWTFSSTSSNSQLAGYSGSFSVTSPSPTAPLFEKQGRLVYVGDYYLKFADGTYWLKGGIDDPENFIGKAFGGWSAKKAAIDYLASKGVNSVYIILNTISPGDRNDTWPWYGATASEAKNHAGSSARFDVAKLDQWRDFFEYCNRKGIVLHLVLEDDSAWDGFDHDRYYKELVARFGYLNAIYWNLGEEFNENHGNSHPTYSAKLASIDPFDHPIGVHRKSVDYVTGDNNLAFFSYQTSGTAQFVGGSFLGMNSKIISARNKTVNHKLMISFDENPRLVDNSTAARTKARQEIFWAVYLGGGVMELHYYDAYGQGGSVTIQALEHVWLDMKRAREFLEALPFWQMAPNNNLASGSGHVYCLAKANEAYAVYTDQGGSLSLNLGSASGIEFDVVWYNPLTGAESSVSTVSGGSTVNLGSAPFSGEAAVKVVKKGLIVVDTTPPSVPSGLNIQNRTENSISLCWNPSTDSESNVSSYNVYRDNVKVGSSSTTCFTDGGLAENTQYNYQVSAVNGSSLESGKSSALAATTLADTQPPILSSVSAHGNPNQVLVQFSEPIEKLNAENISNYQINGISITGAVLDQGATTVTLVTSNLSEGVDYTLTVNNIKDLAASPNTIAANSQKTFQFIQQLGITNTAVTSGKAYVWDTLAVGQTAYIDRSYTFSDVPANLVGAQYLRTANDDKSQTGTNFLSFDVNQSVTVYVAFDDRASTPPAWLTGSFDDSDMDLVTSDTRMSLWALDYPAGTVTLGANSGASSMYTVVVVPAGGPTVENNQFAGNDRPMSISISPNPFNPSTYIRVAGIDRTRIFQLAVFDTCGKLVCDLTPRLKWNSDGIIWEAPSLSSAVYLVRMINGSQVLNKKIVLMR